MTALGQKLPFALNPKESAFGGTTEFAREFANVCFVPKAEIDHYANSNLAKRRLNLEGESSMINFYWSLR